MYVKSPALKIGKEVPKDQLQPDYFEAEEGFVKLIYGRIRQGKSTEAVRVMVEGLTNGKSVYSNIALDLNNIVRPLVLDDRVNTWQIIQNILFFRKRFYAFKNENYRYFDPVTGYVYDAGQTDKGIKVFDPLKKGDEIRWLNTLTDCIIVYDEGQWLLDSYESTYASVDKRKLITETGHVNRTIIIVAQRTQSVHVNARGNVNQFYRCSKTRPFWALGLITVLKVEEFQDMKGQDVDETAQPISVGRYLFHGRYWHLFNTHYLRRGRPRSQFVQYDAFDLTFIERYRVLFWKIFAFALPAFKGGEKKKTKPLNESRIDDIGFSGNRELPEEETIPLMRKADNLTLDLSNSKVLSRVSSNAEDAGKRVKLKVTSIKSQEAVPIVPEPDEDDAGNDNSLF